MRCLIFIVFLVSISCVSQSGNNLMKSESKTSKVDTLIVYETIVDTVYIKDEYFFKDSLLQAKSDSINNFLDNGYYGEWSIEFKNLVNDSVLYSHRKDYKLIPASNMKIITTISALDILGPEFKYETVYEISGEIRKSELHGNIKIIGSGDPTNGRDYFKNRSIGNRRFSNFAHFLRDSLEIKTIRGEIIVDNDFPNTLYGSGWEYDDLTEYYAAPISKLSFNENLIKLNIVNDMVNTSPEYEFSYNFIKDNDTRAQVYRLANTDSLLIISDFNGNYIKYSTVSDPAKLFKGQLIRVLELSNIKVLSKDYENPKILDYYYDKSDSMDVMLYKANSESNNFYAEQLYRTAIEHFALSNDSIITLKKDRNQYYSISDINSAASSIYSILYGINVNPADGSGLSRKNLISAEEMNRVLRKGYKSDHFRQLLHSIAKPGYDGTLENKFSSDILSERVFAKSGSMTNVQCLSGYLVTENGTLVFFSILCNNFSGSSSRIVRYIEYLLEYAVLKF
ncbi:MAG: D-alanyl-D-alanine carboxypeptidase [Candidatus Delongbacteria bacterium]|nr:D-alanyl-D-alanine carboxypeptidase [Candidatus Delongbacteria bacterium]MBN2835213.1 D-alanyl-D-alanine carboxypeptidase [Candidatus Delongbacteria bacterium]